MCALPSSRIYPIRYKISLQETNYRNYRNDFERPNLQEKNIKIKIKREIEWSEPNKIYNNQALR